MDQRRMCPNCRAFITTQDKVCPYCNERVGPRAAERRNPGAILGGFIPHARFVTMIILTINLRPCIWRPWYSASGMRKAAAS